MTIAHDAEHAAPPPTSVQPLLEAVMAIAGDLDLRGVLSRIVVAAASLTEARYGALGVIGGNGELTDFITTGIDESERTLIGEPPHGGGILGVPIRIRGTVFGNRYLTEKAGGRPFTADDENLVLAFANVAGLVIENARTYGLSERRRQWLEAAADLTDALAPPAQVEEAHDAIVTQARAVSGAIAAVLVQFPQDEPPVVAAESVPGTDLRPLVLQVVDQARVAGEQSVALDVDLGAVIARVVPLQAHLARPTALIVLLEPGPAAWFEERDLLVDFCDKAGLALDRAQAVADREQLAVISERARIARDLHDVVIQRLFAAGLNLQGLRAAACDDLYGRIDALVDNLDVTIREIRTTIFGLQRRVA